MDSLESQEERNLQSHQKCLGAKVGLSDPSWEVIIIEKGDTLTSHNTGTIKVRVHTAHNN